VLCITYSIGEILWHHRDREGDYFLKPFTAKPPEIESWNIFLSIDDPLRPELLSELYARRDRFLFALQTGNISGIPRLTGDLKKMKCKRYNYLKRCFQIDDETVDAFRAGLEPSVLDRVFSSQTFIFIDHK
jgi:hypothetical protein